MAKEIILYNLAEHVTDEEYKEYVTKEKGPFFNSLSSVKKFELIKISGSASGEIPYKYIAIVHLTSLDEFHQKDTPSQGFQEFMGKWQTMVSESHILGGEEIY